MPVAFALESFDAVPLDEPSPDYATGFEAGRVAGAAESKAQQDALTEQLVQSVADMEFTYAEARAQVLQSLRPLLDVIIGKLLPHCVTNGFSAMLVDQLCATAMQDCSGPAKIHLHPAQITPVSATLTERSMIADIIPDENISLHTALIEHSQHETSLDLDRVLADINDVLSAIQDIDQRNIAHG